MMNGNGSSSTLAAGKLGGLPSGGAGGGKKPPRHPGRRLKSTHELDGAAVIAATPGASTGSKRPAVPTVAGGGEGERFKCKTCQHFFIAEEDLQCHIRRCHVYRNWRCGREEAPRPPPSVAARKLLSSSSRTKKKGCSVVSKQREQEQEQEQQQTTEAAAVAEAPARTVVDFAFDLNVPVPEVEENTSSG